MPSFAFWKSAKQDETKLPLLSNDVVAEEAEKAELTVPKDLSLDPGNEDSGVFLFEGEDELEPIVPETAGAASIPESTSRATLAKGEEIQTDLAKQDVVVDLLDREDLASQSPIPCLSPDVLSSTETKKFHKTETAESAKLNQDQENSSVQLPPTAGSQHNVLPTNITISTTQFLTPEKVVGSSEIDQEAVLPEPSPPITLEKATPPVETISATQPSAVAEQTESNTVDRETTLQQSLLSSKSNPADQLSVILDITGSATLNNMTPLEQFRPTCPASTDLVATESNAEDSGIYLSESEGISSRSRASSIASSDDVRSRSRPTSLSSRHSHSTKLSLSRQRADSVSSSRNRTDSTAHRLCRPAELNLGSNTAADASKPKSELEKRYDLIRNSKTQSKAALRSPTDLLKDRLNMSPRKIEEKIRIFTPPKPLVNGCLLPGPGASMEAFTSASVRAQTESGGRPAWWCKSDKLVVFDGVEILGEGELKIHTRTSKGLTIARRRGDMESIIIPMDCEHCQEMLNRPQWKYDMRVCKRSVCWDCKERCKWEFEQEKEATSQGGAGNIEQRADANRYRADSMLQDEQGRE